MSRLDDISAAVWAYASRTLASGSPAAPVTRLDYISKAVWENATRTLTSGTSHTATGGTPYYHFARMRQ